MYETEPIVLLRDVSTRQEKERDGHPPLSNVSLSLMPGRVYALMGPKGSGKSSLVRLLAGRIAPCSGLLRYGSALGASNAVRSHTVGYCAQEPELAPDMTVGEHLSLFASISELPEAGRAERIAQIADLLGLAASMDVRVDQSAIGVGQRLHVALSMLHTPRLWLLDEPFRDLDSETAKALWNALRQHARSGGTNLLISSDLGHVEESADRVLFMGRGQLLAEDSPSALAARHGSLAKAYAVLTCGALPS